MLNQIVLVGRITRELEVKELENGKKVANMTIAIPRSFKNAEGVYETDFIDIKVWDSIATNVKEYCRKGDIVGVKGRIQTEEVVDTELQKVYDSVRKQVKDSKDEKKQKAKIDLLTDISTLMVKQKQIIVAEKVTFLSSKSSNESEEE